MVMVMVMWGLRKRIISEINKRSISTRWASSSSAAVEKTPTTKGGGGGGGGICWFEDDYSEYRKSLYGGNITHKALLVDAVGTLLVPAQPTAQDIGEKYGVNYSESEILNRYRWAYSQPWGRSRLRYVDDGRPFWQYIVSSSTGCSDAQYFEELYNYFMTDKAWRLCDPNAEKVFQALRKAGVQVAVVSNFDTRLRPLLRAKSIIFNITTQQNLNNHSMDEIYKYYMLLCLEEATTKFGTKMPSNITLITKEPNGDVKVETLPKQVNFASPKHLKYELSWEELRMSEVDFQKEKGMVDVSLNWTTCGALEGVVVSVISSLCEDKSYIKVFITFPRDH